MNAHRELEPRDVARQLEASSQAMLAAHDADVRRATDSVGWERRGWLGRLVQVDRAPEQSEGQVERDSMSGERLVA